MKVIVKEVFVDKENGTGMYGVGIHDISERLANAFIKSGQADKYTDAEALKVERVIKGKVQEGKQLAIDREREEREAREAGIKAGMDAINNASGDSAVDNTDEISKLQSDLDVLQIEIKVLNENLAAAETKATKTSAAKDKKAVTEIKKEVEKTNKSIDKVEVKIKKLMEKP